MDLYNLVVSAKLTKGGGGGGDVTIDELNVTENGTYTAETSHAYSPVNVSVPVGVFPSGTKSIDSNGIYDVTNFASASVAVPIPSYSTSALAVTENGTYSVPSGVDGFNPVTVNVSGGGGGGSEELDAIIGRTISGSYTNNTATTIGTYAFAYCSELASISFQSATKIDAYAFFSCSSLTTASFPNVTSIGGSAFAYCSKLASISFPSATTIIDAYAFAYCSSLTTASFPNVTSIGGSVFRTCQKLMSLYVLASSVAKLGSSAFVGTPMSNSTYTGSFGSIYVPASLVSSYKSATNWSVYSARITSYV